MKSLPGLPSSSSYYDGIELYSSHWLESQLDFVSDQLKKNMISQLQAIKIFKLIKDLSEALIAIPAFDKSSLNTTSIKLESLHKLFQEAIPTKSKSEVSTLIKEGQLVVSPNVQKECTSLWDKAESVMEKKGVHCGHFFNFYLLENYPLPAHLNSEEGEDLFMWDFVNIIRQLHPNSNESDKFITLPLLLRFVNYFGPFTAEGRPHILERMNALLYFKHFSLSANKESQNHFLNKESPGKYMLRFSESKPDFLVLSTVLVDKDMNKTLAHELISVKDGMLKRKKGGMEEMPIEKIEEFIEKFLALSPYHKQFL
jgi:hypothetical protein